MIIIKLQGGLGNQLFQYSAYLNLHLQGYNVYLDVTEYNLPKNDSFRKYYLNDFKVTLPIKKCSFTSSFLQLIRKKLFIPSIRFFNKKVLANMNHINIHAGLDLSDDLHEITNNSYTEGYFLNERFIPVNFFEFFQFSNKIKNKLNSTSIYKKITNSYSVSIHIRRLDYINNPEYDSICTIQYYKKAISYFMTLNKATEFFFFSDDIAWVKNNFSNQDNFNYIENLSNFDNTIFDLYLMSSCKHNIIANSTFSWWAAYLNKTPYKIVICPNKYQNNSNFTFYPNSWVNIDNL